MLASTLPYRSTLHISPLYEYILRHPRVVILQTPKTRHPAVAYSMLSARGGVMSEGISSEQTEDACVHDFSLVVHLAGRRQEQIDKPPERGFQFAMGLVE